MSSVVPLNSSSNIYSQKYSSTNQDEDELIIAEIAQDALTNTQDNDEKSERLTSRCALSRSSTPLPIKISPSLIGMKSSSSFPNLSLLDKPSDSQEIANQQTTYFGWISKYYIDGAHPSKEHKYFLALDFYAKRVNDLGYDLKGLLSDVKKLISDSGPEDVEAKQYYELTKVLIESLLLIDSSTGDKSKNYREFYLEKFILNIRQLVSSSKNDQIDIEYNQKIKKMIQELCYIRWSQLNIYTYLKGILDITTSAYLEVNSSEHNQRLKVENLSKNLTAESFSKSIQELNLIIQKAPEDVKKSRFALWWQMFCGEFGIEDYTGRMNLPYTREKFVYQIPGQGDREILYSRHGCPTKPYYGNKLISGVVAAGAMVINRLATQTNTEVSTGEHVVEDYEAYVREAAIRGNNILYCNHQRMIPGAESSRVKAILDLETRLQNEGINNFNVLVQTLDGKFFGYIDSYNKPVGLRETFAELIKSIYEEFQPKQEGESFKVCQLPKLLHSDKSYNESLLGLLTDVKKIFFGNKEKIEDLIEQHNFILLFYAFQKIDMKIRLNIAHYTTPCKDFLDRGGCMALVEERLHDYYLNEQNNPEIMFERIVNTLGAPILVKKKEMVLERLSQAVSVDEFLYKFSQNADQLKILQSYKFYLNATPLKIDINKANIPLWEA